VRVKPNSGEEVIKEIGKNNFEVSLKEKAEKGKANTALLKALARHFRISSSEIRIRKGITSHNKIVGINQG
jgi:uncharacterized protein YggU (UPF0235/DUF167 family)